MRILLIKPYCRYPLSKADLIFNRIWPPLSLANCAALLEKEGYKVKILDVHAERIRPNGIVNYVKGYDKIFITSSSLDRWQCPNLDIDSFLETVRRVREITDEVYIMGYHGTVRPKEILQVTNARAVIRGEPEMAVLDISQERNLKDIEGITYRTEREVVSNRDRDFLDLNDLPMPAFHLLDFSKYFYEILGDRFALFEGSRGCPYACRFCSKAMQGVKLRVKLSSHLIKEINEAITKYNVKTGYFIDLNFTLNRRLVEDVCNFLIKKRYNFKWCCQTRADLLDEESLEKMKRAGCELIHFGVETGSDRLMRWLNKDISLNEIERGVRLTKAAGIKTLCFFIFGIPVESIKEMGETIRFAKRLNPTFAIFHSIFPYLGSSLFEEMRDKTKKMFPMECFNSYLLSQLKDISRKAFFKFYLRPVYILSSLRGGQDYLNIKAIFRQLRLLLEYLH
jgi:radical SAM superfamily enzyme YgiQ (UPF0313 family)